MKIAIVCLSVLSVVLIAVVIVAAVLMGPQVVTEAPQGYDMGFVDGCIGGISLSYPEGQRPPYQEAWDDCNTMKDLVKDATRPLAKPPEIQKSHIEELEEQGIEVFHTAWRVP